MAVEAAAESCGSHPAAATSSSSAAAAQARKQQQQQRHKLEVYTDVLQRLHDAGVPEAQSPGFDTELWNHFNRLPSRYAMDVNVERAEDVLTHKRLLEQARDPAQRPAFAVRVVQVIEHKPYDHKADVFSFGILMWELLTGKIPYEYLTPLQAAVGVVQKGLRPTIPKNIHAKLAELLQKCWQQDPAQRPDFSEILETLQRIAEEVGDEHEGKHEGKHKEKILGGLFSALRGRGH